MNFSLIVAVSNNRVIGGSNKMPWHLPRDLTYFKEETLNCPVIMGRKTYESIGKALPKRFNIVVSRQAKYQLPDAMTCQSLGQAKKVATDYAIQYNAKTVFIIGGGELFRQSFDFIDILYITHVLTEVEGDVYLPEINFDDWEAIRDTFYKKDDKNSYDMRFVVYRRKVGLPIN